MAKPNYTKEDMRELARMSATGSIPAVFLPKFDYSPRKFKDFLKSKGLATDVHYLFELDGDDVPPLIADDTRRGYLLFRSQIGK